MNRQRATDLGLLVLRVTIASLMLLHGAHKLTHGVARIGERLASHGLPRFVSWGVYVGEVVAPLFILAGFGTRIAAAVLAVNMVVAVALQHVPDLARRTSSGAWGVELQALYLFGAVAIALLGSGRYAVSRGKGRWD